MSFGSGLQLHFSTKFNPLILNHPVILGTTNQNAQLIVGDQFAMSGGAICIAEKVIIGNYVTVGANSAILDKDFHPLSASMRSVYLQEEKSKHVIIENDVFKGTIIDNSFRCSTLNRNGFHFEYSEDNPYTIPWIWKLFLHMGQFKSGYF